MVNIKLNGVEYHLLFNYEAYSLMQEKLGTANPIEIVSGSEMKRTAQAVVMLAEQGELLRRWLGQEPQPMLTFEEVILTISPVGAAILKNAVITAVSDGLKRSSEKEGEEVDLGLAELNKKKWTY